jgi:hypothetical protein
MSQQQQMQQAKQQRNLGTGDSALDNLWAAMVHSDSPLVQNIRGFIQSAVHTGTGDWLITLSAALPFGEYLAGWANLTGAFGVTIEMTDGDATHKLLAINVNVAGVPTPIDVNGFAVWWARAFSN